MIYLTVLYIFVLAVFVSAIGGFLIYKVSHISLNVGSLSQILGGIVSLVLSFLLSLAYRSDSRSGIYRVPFVFEG